MLAKLKLAIAENKREAKLYAERYQVIESHPDVTAPKEENIHSSFKTYKTKVKEEDDNQMSLF